MEKEPIVRDAKLSKPVFVGLDASVVDAAKKIRDERVKHVVVLDAQNHPVGIVAAVDIVNRLIAEGKDYKNVKVSDIMTSPIFFVRESDTLEQAYFGMVQKGTFSVPVVSDDGHKFIGMINFNIALAHMAMHKTLRGGKKDGE